VKIADKVFVVTGGGNGIGREVVLGLLARGARVAAVDLSEDGLAGTALLDA
jgi:NAD(P)-dependent dehydrogenase (short-subunit alcohol dehydrogenase family)